MADVNFQRGTEAKINSTSTVDGTLSFATDTKKIFLDTSSSNRIEFGGEHLGIIPCTMSSNTVLTIPINKPKTNTIIVGCITTNSHDYKFGDNTIITVKFIDSTSQLYPNIYPVSNFELYSIFAIFMQSSSICQSLGTLNSIDGGIV